MALFARDVSLGEVERLINEAKERIERQRQVVANAFQQGRDTEIPISMLRALEASLQAFDRVPMTTLGDRTAWLPFLNTYRTMCIAPEPAFRRILEDIRNLKMAA